MKDNFEKFIANNRSEIDVFEPREKVWKAIDEELNRQKRVKRLYCFSTAASILIIIGVIALLRFRANEQAVMPMNTVNAEIKKAEQYYAGMIEEKRNELSRYCSTQPGLCNEFDKELDTLNLLYGQLKHEYNASADKEVVLQAMINNLQVQLQVLSQQLQVIQRVDTMKQRII